MGRGGATTRVCSLLVAGNLAELQMSCSSLVDLSAWRKWIEQRPWPMLEGIGFRARAPAAFKSTPLDSDLPGQRFNPAEHHRPAAAGAIRFQAIESVVHRRKPAKSSNYPRSNPARTKRVPQPTVSWANTVSRTSAAWSGNCCGSRAQRIAPWEGRSPRP
jgi:hypothetical protein